MWVSVSKMLERGVDDMHRCHAVEEASKRADDWIFKLCILPHCRDNEMEDILENLLRRDMWVSLDKVLERRVDDIQRKHAVEEASNRADDSFFHEFILSHCHGSELHEILENLVSRGMWESVAKVLERGVDDIQHGHAVEEASKRADDCLFVECILPQCHDNDIHGVLKNLLARGMWRSVGKVLEKGVSDTEHKNAVEEASQRADGKVFEHYILPHFTVDHVYDVVNNLLARGLRATVEKVLKGFDTLTRSLIDGSWKLLVLPYMLNTNETVSASQRRYVVEKASREAFEDEIQFFVLRCCSADDRDAILPHLVTRGMWSSVGKVIEEGVSDIQRSNAIRTAVEKAFRYQLASFVFPHCTKEDWARVVLPALVASNRVEILEDVIHDAVVYAIIHWTNAITEKKRRATQVQKVDGDRGFWRLMMQIRVNTSLAQRVLKLITHDQNLDRLKRRIENTAIVLNSNEREMVVRSVLFILCCVICGGLTEDLQRQDDSVISEIHKVIFKSDVSSWFTKLLIEVGSIHPSSEKNLMISLSVAPRPLQLPSAIKSVVLKNNLQERQWNFVGFTSLSNVWEQDRRDLFQAAVEQGKWNIVKKWVDHTVYENQRWWAMEQAYKAKQWQVMLVLADHGLTATELMWVRYRIAMYADWDIVLQMFGRGVDVTEVRELVENVMTSSKTERDPAKHVAMVNRWRQLVEAEEKLTFALYKGEGGSDKMVDSSSVDKQTRRVAKLRALKAAKKRKWNFVFFYFFRHFNQDVLQIALQSAIESQTWHVVIQLVRLLDMDTCQRDSFFMEMFRRQQWAVCKAVIDQSVSVQLCLNVLPKLMEMDQWSLVARMMEFNVDDALRRQVMQHALESREGTVVWRCISTMQHYRLSVEERKELFQIASSYGIWQAVKPLVEEKDSTGFQHRDKALLAAIEQHVWDLVDYCQLHHADIDMRDNHKETPLNRAAKKSDWRAVEELVVRGANPKILDRSGYSVLYRAILAEQWDIVKLLIECLGDIHQLSSMTGCTPLQFLITLRKGDIIHHTLMWSPDQSEGVNDQGETTLHAMALDKRPDLLYRQVVRGVNPLAVTKTGQSVVVYAVQNAHCSQRMLAECIRLGFSTHQPSVTVEVMPNFVELLLKSFFRRRSQDVVVYIKSPLLMSVLQGSPVLSHMLYESGSCSYTELYYLYHRLLELTDPYTEDGRKFQKEAGREVENYGKFIQRIETFLPDLQEMATTPRSLVSSCRLVISHCLNVRRRYTRDVQKLPLINRMKNYIMFSDLTDPDYSAY